MVLQVRDKDSGPGALNQGSFHPIPLSFPEASGLGFWGLGFSD